MPATLTARPPAAVPIPRESFADGTEEEFASARTGVRMTAEEFLNLPPDPTLDRWLIDGEVWEQPMTVRSVPHTDAEFHICVELGQWLKTLPEPRPRGGAGEAGVRFPGRDTAIGIDVVMFDAETVAAQPPPPGPGGGMHLWHGVPLLAVEIRSPSDRDVDVEAKVAEYLTAGVPQVWEVRPGLRAVIVHRPDADPRMVSGDQPLDGDPELPGFEIPTSALFGG